jgi:hypothetical protein
MILKSGSGRYASRAALRSAGGPAGGGAGRQQYSIPVAVLSLYGVTYSLSLEVPRSSRHIIAIKVRSHIEGKQKRGSANHWAIWRRGTREGKLAISAHTPRERLYAHPAAQASSSSN